MKKQIALISILGLMLVFLQAGATVTVSAGPASLVTDPVLVKASSSQVGLFSFTSSQDAGETLSSVKIVINNTASSTASTTDFASVSVYKDNGDGNFSATTDLLSASQSSVNLGSATEVTTGSNNAIDGGKFFVSFATSASWSDAAPADSVTVTFPVNGITTSANSPTVTAATTNTIIADTTGPTLQSAVAKNTGGTTAKESGDSVELAFSETTNKPTINSGNINTVFALNNSHSFLDADGNLGGAAWSIDGKVMTVTLSGTTTPTNTVATVAVGDNATVGGSLIMDLAGNLASGTKTITGSFATTTSSEEPPPLTGTKCGNGLINGRLYQVSGSQTVYLAAACRLKAFRGAAVFHARGLKFQNIIKLSSLEGLTVSDKPALPESGALVKGSNATVWFITTDNVRRGFRSAGKFLALGFSFKQVKQISDDDLALISQGGPIEENENHPNGALFKCGNSPLVFQVIGSTRFPFRSANAFLSRGHSWDNIAVVDCGRFHYIHGSAVE